MLRRTRQSLWRKVVKKVASNNSAVSGIDGGSGRHRDAILSIYTIQSTNMLPATLRAVAPATEANIVGSSLRVSCLPYKQAKLLNNLFGCTIQGNQFTRTGSVQHGFSGIQEVLAIRRKKHPSRMKAITFSLPLPPYILFL